jgi:hypothetical protein
VVACVRLGTVRLHVCVACVAACVRGRIHRRRIVYSYIPLFQGGHDWNK